MTPISILFKHRQYLKHFMNSSLLGNDQYNPTRVNAEKENECRSNFRAYPISLQCKGKYGYLKRASKEEYSWLNVSCTFVKRILLSLLKLKEHVTK